MNASVSVFNMLQEQERTVIANLPTENTWSEPFVAG
jgi:hypothetical protein